METSCWYAGFLRRRLRGTGNESLRSRCALATPPNTWPNVARNQPDSAEFGPESAELGSTQRNLVGPESFRTRRSSAKSHPRLTDFDDFGRIFWTARGNGSIVILERFIGPHFAESGLSLSSIDKRPPRFDRPWAIVAKVGPTSAKLGPNSAMKLPDKAGFGSIGGELGQSWPKSWPPSCAHADSGAPGTRRSERGP